MGGVRARRGHRLGGQGRARARLLARLVGRRGSRRSPRRRRRPVVEGEPTLFEIWVCADGYWCDHTKNLVAGELTPQYRELEDGLMGVYEDAIEFARPGREPRGARPAHPRRDRRAWASRASRRTRSATASARGPTSRRTRTRPAAARSRPAWFLQSSQDAISRAAVGFASRTTSSITDGGAEKLSRVPGRHRLSALERLPSPERAAAAPARTEQLEALRGEHRVVARVRVDASRLHRVPLDHRCAVFRARAIAASRSAVPTPVRHSERWT